MAAKILPSLAVGTFCETLAMMLEDGIQVDEALGMIRGERDETVLYAPAGAVLQHYLASGSLAGAVAQSGFFPAYATDLIAIGEASGRTDEVLKSLGAHYRMQDLLKNRLRSAVVYPAVLLLMISLVLAVLVWQVLPVFTGVYTSLAGSVASSSYAYITAANVIGCVSLCLVAAAAAALLLCLLACRSAQGEEKLLRLMERLPFAADASRRMAEAQFTTALATFAASGLDTDTAFERAAATVTHRALRAQLEAGRREMAEGRSLAQAVYSNRIFEPFYAHMLKAGTDTGNLEEVLRRLSDLFTEDANAKLDAVIGSVEPVLAGFLTVSVGATLLSVMLPLIGILTSIG